MHDKEAAESRSPRKAKGSSGRRKPAHGRKAKSVLERALVQGWKTSDQDEITLRRWRGRTEILDVVANDRETGFFGLFRARSASGVSYEVEVRSLDRPTNSCGCIDHRVNGLGTCKHIEGVLAAIQRGRTRAFRAAAKLGNPKIEVFLDRCAASTPAIEWPSQGNLTALAPARQWLKPWLQGDGSLSKEPDRIGNLLEAWPKAPEAVTAALRVSRHFGPWVEHARSELKRRTARAEFEADLAAGRDTIDVLAFPLLPYQRLGAMHLAFGERALLADDMGLGKTIQAIAACELLARRKGIKRVLVVCPASLKAEWEEQIARFSERSIRLVYGPRAQRLAAFGDPAFFTIVNYEQVVSDANEINSLLKPDVVVLDEAQRIKNWQTKTARRVKSLRAPHAFVLTGTPVENRIDELYSIVQYLDPEILGPLFRFNRDFYELDDRGRPVDYKNLANLRARISPVMLRRRKAEVEKELPGRTVKNYFVAMAEEQKSRYEDYRMPAAQLIAQAQRRPLRKQEFERLQMLLACMRMTCDTPAILDPTCRISPKLEELEGVLEDILAEEGRKVIVFSEWERMLTMVRELAGEMGFETAWHTGSVPQGRRRAEISRFKQDPNCRLFLSTDSGSAGLNLQVASAVVNIDLPWNPAKLEQRIARAWRKNQTRSVSVINLVTEGSIEHSILHLLGQKQALADGVLDGDGDLSALKMPSGRGAFIERMQAVMAEPKRSMPPVLSPENGFVADLVCRLGENALLVEAREGLDGRSSLLAVLDLDRDALAAEIERGSGALEVEFVDKAAWLAMQRLAATGMLRFTHQARMLHRSPALPPGGAELMPNDGRGVAAMAEADRLLKMAKVLAAGGFAEEAPQLLAKSLRGMAVALAAKRAATPAAFRADGDIRRLIDEAALPAEALTILDAANGAGMPRTASAVEPLIAATARILATIMRNEPGLHVRSSV
ncbi:MAG: DEAD/DEAH box helicase [Xanthobacteraceae bacterium]